MFPNEPSKEEKETSEFLLKVIKRSRKLEQALIDIINHRVVEDESEFDFLELTSMKATGYNALKEIAQEGLND